MKPILMLVATLFAGTVHAQVLSYTMGIDVNCPSGLGE